MIRFVWPLAFVCILALVINYFKILVDVNGSIKCLIGYLLVILEVRLCSFPVSVNYMVEQIYRLDSHETCIFIVSLCDAIFLNGFKYFLLEGLVYGCVVFKYLECFYLCIVGLFLVTVCGICSHSSN